MSKREEKLNRDLDRVYGCMGTSAVSVKEVAKRTGFSIPKVTRLVDYMMDEGDIACRRERRGKRGPLTTVYWWQP